MWTPNLVTVLKKKHERRSNIYNYISVFKKQFIYMIIIVRRKRAVAQQSNGGAAGRWCAKWASAD